MDDLLLCELVRTLRRVERRLDVLSIRENAYRVFVAFPAEEAENLSSSENVISLILPSTPLSLESAHAK
jgi:hypothetical protein